jgi:hypothetical protein
MDAAFTIYIYIYEWRQNSSSARQKSPTSPAQRSAIVDSLFGTQPAARDAASWSGSREEVGRFCKPT